MRLPNLTLAALLPLALGACEAPRSTTGVVGEDGLGARIDAGRVRAAAGPDDAAVALEGDQVIAGVGTDAAAAGVRVDDNVILGGGRQRRGGTFGGIGFGF